MFFDIGPLEMVALVVLAVLIFGPDKLPKLVADVMGFIRKVREFSDSAKEDIRKELGPEYQDFEFQDLHPKNFVRKQLSKHGDEYGLSEFKDLKDGLTADAASATAAVKGVRNDPLAKVAAEESAPLKRDEPAPYDLDAT